MNKKSLLLMFAIVLMTNILFSQNVTLNVTILNNKAESVELKSAYDKDAAVLAKEKISNDKFVIKAKITTTDLFALNFSNNQSFLLCLSPGENITLTIDGNNIQSVPSVSGSSSMLFIKELTDIFASRQKVLDSLNHLVQHNPDQLYFTNFTAKFQPYYQSQTSAAADVKSAVECNDSLLNLNFKYAPKGTVDKKSVDLYLPTAIKHLKVMKNYYSSYRTYADNAATTFEKSKPGTINGYEEFNISYNAYTKAVEEHDGNAETLFTNYMEKASALLTEYDDLFYDGKLDATNAKRNFSNRIVSLINEYGQRVAAAKTDQAQSVEFTKSVGSQLLQLSKSTVQNLVNGYQQEFNRRDAVANENARKLMSAHKTDLAALMFLDNFAQDKAMQTEVVTALNTLYPEHPLVKERWNRINTPQFRTSEGSIAPELSFNDPNGKPRKLSDLRGKVVLIDFWASWCGPCRRENPHVVAMYNKYHDKGFEVFSVSLDKDANSWKTAIAKDGLVWPNHVSDLKGWGSAAAKLYGVSSIPCTFLVDKEGRILAKGLRGEALTQALQQLFGE